MHTDIGKAWTPAEIKAAAKIERAQTAPFLLGEMAFKGLVLKMDSGAYKILQ